MDACHSLYVEVRGQLAGVVLFFHHVGPKDWTQAVSSASASSASHQPQEQREV